MASRLIGCQKTPDDSGWRQLGFASLGDMDLSQADFRVYVVWSIPGQSAMVRGIFVAREPAAWEKFMVLLPHGQVKNSKAIFSRASSLSEGVEMFNRKRSPFNAQEVASIWCV